MANQEPIVHFMNGRRLKLRSLTELGLGFDGDHLFEALRPFASEANSEQYKAEVKLRRRRARKRLLRRFRRGWASYRRHVGEVIAEYDDAWKAGHARYDMTHGPQKLSPWRWRGRKLFVNSAGSARMRSVMIGAVIETVRPARVLEVGCGDGINLILLAGAFPDVSFTGLELTDAGHKVAVDLQSRNDLPEHLSAYAPLVQKDRQAFKRIDFVQGNACAMPYEPNSFDLVLTVLSIEQMEHVREAALDEIARVTKGHLLSLEPFRDVNRSPWRLANVAGRDYFRGSIAELRKHGLEPLWATADYPQEEMLGSALVLSRKVSNQFGSNRPA